jgi:hypothetical protein
MGSVRWNEANDHKPIGALKRRQQPSCRRVAPTEVNVLPCIKLQSIEGLASVYNSIWKVSQKGPILPFWQLLDFRGKSG